MPDAKVDPEVAELRLAVVCYGGVSLAVYMHGITKELRKLVVASRAFETAPDSPPADGTELAYFNALKAISEAGRPLRVIIDVISGTSAGGINGVCLGTALANNGDDAVLRNLWLDRGDIGGLLHAPGHQPLTMRLTEVVGHLLAKPGSFNPLNGDKMAGWLHDAIRKIVESRTVTTGTGTDLVPADQSLHLRVTTTDLSGYERVVDTGAGGPPLDDRAFKHVYCFDYQPGGDSSFDDDVDVAALALAARCTSSIPGAFAPVGLSAFLETIESRADLDELIRRYFGTYKDNDVDPRQTVFVDGGVLDNAPFDYAIDLIAGQPAERQVVRRIVYLEPDPHAASTTYADEPEDAKTPGWLRAASKAVMTVSRHEPLVQQLVRLQNLNTRVQEVGAIADAQMGAVQGILDECAKAQAGDAALTDLNLDQLRSLSAALHKKAQANTLSYPTYIRLKLQEAVTIAAGEIARHAGYHEESRQATFIRLSLLGSLQQGDRMAGGTTTTDLLDALDVGYRRRRLQFVLQGVNALYSAPDAPPRAEINALKGAIWSRLESITNAGAIAASGLPVDAWACFARAALTDDTLALDPQKFASSSSAALDTLCNVYGATLKPLIETTNQQLWDEFRGLTTSWPDAHRRDIGARYVAFPIWDQLLFPIVALSETPQFTPIRATRFSPDRATLLKDVGVPGKLRGLGFHHFAAFFHRDWRENDYLWGRLDGAEIILRLLHDAAGVDVTDAQLGALAGPAFMAVLDAEEDLEEITELRDDIRARAAKL